MANTLTGLIPDIYEALDVVSRELVGFIPAVRRDSGVERAALNQTVVAHQSPASVAQDMTPGINPPDAGDQTIGNVSLSITKSRGVPVRWNGEEQLSLSRGPGYNAILVDQFSQAFRTLTNEIEVDLAAAAKTTASRAYGTAATTPFDTAGNYEEASQVRKILIDNGCPVSELQMVLNTTASAKLLGKQGGRGVNLEGNDSLLRQGVFQDIHGMAVRESVAAAIHTKGTGSGWLSNLIAGYAIGDTTIAADTGSGTILAGDVVTFTGDSNKYVVTVALAGGSFSIGAPGLLAALANNIAITVGNTYAHNAVFRRSSIVLATRLRALPAEGDSAHDREVVIDPVSGLAFEVAMYKQFGQVQYWVAVAWGTKGVKNEHNAILLG